MKSVYFGKFHYQLGDIRSIDELPGLSGQDELKAYLSKCGFANYRKSSQKPAQLVFDCVKKLFDAQPDLARSIDTIVYATLTLSESEFYNEQLGDCLTRLGLEKAALVGVFSSECGNIGSALLIAQSLIEAGRANNVLIITADVCLDESKRIVDGNVVVSDGASCCIVSTDSNNDFILINTCQRSNHRLRMEPSAAYSPRFLKLSTDGMKECIDSVLTSASVDRSNVDLFLTGNYAKPVLAMFSYVAGVNSKIHFSADVSGTAHAYACDLIINLDQALAKKALAAGDKVLCLTTGKSTWFASLIIKT